MAETVKIVMSVARGRFFCGFSISAAATARLSKPVKAKNSMTAAAPKLPGVYTPFGKSGVKLDGSMKKMPMPMKRMNGTILAMVATFCTTLYSGTPNRFTPARRQKMTVTITFFIKSSDSQGMMPASAVAKPTPIVEKAMMRVIHVRKPTS